MLNIIVLLTVTISSSVSGSGNHSSKLDHKDNYHHPNSVYSQILKHSSSKQKADLKIFYQTGVRFLSHFYYLVIGTKVHSYISSVNKFGFQPSMFV